MLTLTLCLWIMDVGPLTLMITKRASGRIVPFFLWSASSRVKEWVPNGVECPSKGRYGKERYDGGGISIRWVGLWEGPRAGGSSCSGAAKVAWVSPPCHEMQKPMPHPGSKEGHWRKCTMATAWLNQWPNLVIKKTSWKVVYPFWAILACFLLCFLSSLSHADLHIYVTVSESAHSAHTLAEILPG